MSSYIDVIKIAFLFFPFVAFIISIPFILIEYHKFGSISFYRSIIIYSFFLYLICAYFLVILPLPEKNEVALLTTPRTQLIPFKFILDFIRNTSLNISDINTYLKSFKESYFYVPVYNILITLPFSMYLRYYFKCSMKKIIIWTFSLSLFFELTQLSGLYFIYPRGYRLFDVDDLLLNTIGGIIGYLVAKPIIKFLPTMQQLELRAKEKGKTISGFRRSTSLLLDLFIISVVYMPLSLIKFKYMFNLLAAIYYFVIPLFMNGTTLSEKFLNIMIVGNDNNTSIWRILCRRLLFLTIYILLPSISLFIIKKFVSSNGIRIFLNLIIIGVTFVYYIISIFKYLFTNKILLYEKISKTKLISTIK